MAGAPHLPNRSGQTIPGQTIPDHIDHAPCRDYPARSKAGSTTIEHEYASLARLLLHCIATRQANSSLEQEQTHHLIRQLRPTLSLESLQTLRDQIKALLASWFASSSPIDDIDQIQGLRDAEEESLVTSLSGHDPEEVQLPLNLNEPTQLESDKIKRIQSELTRLIEFTISQNQAFGNNLNNELRTLRSVTGIEKVERVRQELLEELESIVQGQHRLISQLNNTQQYLQEVAVGSQQLNEELRRVRRLSLTDDLTGLPNRRALTQRLEDELSRAQRSSQPFALAMIDLDGFKMINDKYGHSCGDAILRSYAELMLTIFRHHDMVARYGGEEFAAILPYTLRQDAMTALRKLQSRVMRVPLSYEQTTLVLPTFSAGIALYQSGDTLLTLVNRADQAMYRAKRLGRNRIEVEDAAACSDTPCSPSGHQN